jgi:hypothetical protein
VELKLKYRKLVSDDEGFSAGGGLGFLTSIWEMRKKKIIL